MNRIPKILFYLLMVTLLLPMAQQEFDLVEIKPLHGAIKERKKPSLNLDNWFSEKYQKRIEKYAAQKFGFANWFVRVENQIQFTFYNKAKARDAIVGKEKYLYEKSYIDAYYGNDFMGKKPIQELYTKLKLLSDTLETLNKKILIVFAPGKGRFFSEYIPDDLKAEKKLTNLKYCVETVDSLGLDYIDMSTWFINMKDTASFPLYAKTGIHWSTYGVKLAIDSIATYCQNNLGLTLNNYTWKPIDMSLDLTTTDMDIEKGMNMIFKIPNYPMPYTKMKFTERKPNTARTIIIADSFFWQMFNLEFTTKLFQKGQFWFYNKKVFSKNIKGKITVEDLDLNQEILNQDIIILLTTEPILKRKYWGFVDMAYEAIFNPKPFDYHDKQIELITNKIKSSPKWMVSIKKKALAKDISIDSMIILDAEYVYKQKLKKAVK